MFHNETFFTIASDPEATRTTVSIIHKFDNDEDKLSLDAFRKGLIFNLYNSTEQKHFVKLTNKVYFKYNESN